MDRLKRQKAFGENLYRLFDEQGLSLRQFAAMCNTSPSYMSKVVNGKVNLSLARIIDFADALGVPVSELVKPCDLPA